MDNGIVVVNEKGIVYGGWLLYYLSVCSLRQPRGVEWLGGYVTVAGVRYKLKGASVEDIGEEVNSILASGGRNVSEVVVEVWFWGDKLGTSYGTLLVGQWRDDGCFVVKKL